MMDGIDFSGMTPHTATPFEDALNAALALDDAPRLPGVSVVLPCFDKVDVVALSALAASRHIADACEVIIVDDGSTDGRLCRAIGLMAHHAEVRVIEHSTRLGRGRGAAMRTGIEAATRPWTLLTGADGQLDLFELDRLLESARDHDVVVGFRDAPAGRAPRLLNGVLWTPLLLRSLGLPVRDLDWAFKLIRTELVQGIPPRGDGTLFSAELLAHARQEGARIAEIPVTRTASPATGARLGGIVKAFLELVSLRGGGAQ
jgi:glycosyltransferase involved in cell wall biosynthesis